MADVRALLREQRLARRINHPYASYSTAGTLSCNVCNLRLQAESLWEPHLAGKVHKQNLQRAQAASKSIHLPTRESEPIPPNVNGNGRKRKAEDEDQAQPVNTGKKRKAPEEEEDNETSRDSSLRKKAKATPQNALPKGFFDGKTNEEVLGQDSEQEPPTINEPQTGTTQPRPSTEVDDEYAAFEAAIAAAPIEDEIGPTRTVQAFAAGADISAAPVSAAELAARETDEMNEQRTGREEEMEGEKEDAARALEEEFDEMDQLEARVKKLREMRERLRTEQQQNRAEEDSGSSMPVVVADESDENDDDEYEDDDWGFR